MPDCFATQIIIGGSIPKKAVTELLKVIGDSGLSLEWGDASFCPTTEEELLDALADDGLLHLYDDQCAWGELPELILFLQDNQIGFDKRVEGRYEYGPQLVRYRPGMKDLLIQTTTNDFVPIIEQVEVEKARNLLRRSKPRAALKLLEELCSPDVPKLAALTIEEQP
jgi:hypothetical protein